MRIDRLDHLVLTVRDVDATCSFYARVLGMQVVTFGEARSRFWEPNFRLDTNYLVFNGCTDESHT